MSEDRRQALWAMLGDLPERRPISAKTVAIEQYGGFRLERLVLDLNGIEPVPALLVIPDELKARAPAVVYNHAHGGNYALGKEELLRGRKALVSPYLSDLVNLGCITLCIDAWCFGERAHRSEMDTFKRMLWHGQWLWGMMMWDSFRAVDYLLSRPDVDPDRIATLGLSMGCTAAWWLAALDPRVAVAVGLVCLTEYRALLEHEALDTHGIYYFIPGLLKQFGTADIVRLIAPRPFLSLNGDLDRSTPPEGVDRVLREARPAWEAAGAADALRILRYPVPHQETEGMRDEVVGWLKKYLVG